MIKNSTLISNFSENKFLLLLVSHKSVCKKIGEMSILGVLLDDYIIFSGWRCLKGYIISNFMLQTPRHVVSRRVF